MLVVKLLKEEKTWADKVLLTYAVLAAVYGTLQLAYNAWHAIDSYLHPKLVNAVVNTMDLQDPHYEMLTVTFLNPTDRTQSMDQVEFACDKGNLRMMLFPTNDFSLPIQPSIVQMPMALEAGVTRRVDFMLPKIPDHLVSRDCETLQVYWLDADRKTRSGDVMTIPKDAPYMRSGIPAKD